MDGRCFLYNGNANWNYGKVPKGSPQQCRLILDVVLIREPQMYGGCYLIFSIRK